MGKAQPWQRKQGDPIEGPLIHAGAMLAEIAEEIPRLCLAHRRLAPEAPGRTLALLERLRIVRNKLAEVDLLQDELAEARRILDQLRKEQRCKRNRSR